MKFKSLFGMLLLLSICFSGCYGDDPTVGDDSSDANGGVVYEPNTAGEDATNVVLKSTAGDESVIVLYVRDFESGASETVKATRRSQANGETVYFTTNPLNRKPIDPNAVLQVWPFKPKSPAGLMEQTKAILN